MLFATDFDFIWNHFLITFLFNVFSFLLSVPCFVLLPFPNAHAHIWMCSVEILLRYLIIFESLIFNIIYLASVGCICACICFYIPFMIKALHTHTPTIQAKYSIGLDSIHYALCIHIHSHTHKYLHTSTHKIEHHILYCK